MKISPADTKLTQHDQRIALVLMDGLMKTVGPGADNDNDTGTVTAKDLHRVLALMSAMVLETDPSLLKLRDFRAAGDYIGDLIAVFAKMIREERERTGLGMMDHVGSGSNCTAKN